MCLQGKQGICSTIKNCGAAKLALGPCIEPLEMADGHSRWTQHWGWLVPRRIQHGWKALLKEEANSAGSESLVLLPANSCPTGEVLTSVMIMSWHFLTYLPSALMMVCRKSRYWTWRPWVATQWMKCCGTVSLISEHSW